MTITELKIEIIKRLVTIDDKDILGKVCELLATGSESEDIYQLSGYEKELIHSGLLDVLADRVYSSDESQVIVRTMLNKRK